MRHLVRCLVCWRKGCVRSRLVLGRDGMIERILPAPVCNRCGR